MTVKRALVFRFRDFPISELLLDGELPAFIDQPCYIYTDREGVVVDPCTAIKEADVDLQSTEALSTLVKALSDMDDNVHRLKYLTGSENNTMLRVGYHVSASFAEVCGVFEGQGFQVASAADYMAARRSDLGQPFPRAFGTQKVLRDDLEVAVRLEELGLCFDWRGVDLSDDFGHALQAMMAEGFDDQTFWQGAALWLDRKEQIGVLSSGSWALHLAKQIERGMFQTKRPSSVGPLVGDAEHIDAKRLSLCCYRSLSALKRPIPNRIQSVVDEACEDSDPAALAVSLIAQRRTLNVGAKLATFAWAHSTPDGLLQTRWTLSNGESRFVSLDPSCFSRSNLVWAMPLIRDQLPQVPESAGLFFRSDQFDESMFQAALSRFTLDLSDWWAELRERWQGTDTRQWGLMTRVESLAKVDETRAVLNECLQLMSGDENTQSLIRRHAVHLLACAPLSLSEEALNREALDEAARDEQAESRQVLQAFQLVCLQWLESEPEPLPMPDLVPDALAPNDLTRLGTEGDPEARRLITTLDVILRNPSDHAADQVVGHSLGWLLGQESDSAAVREVATRLRSVTLALQAAQSTWPYEDVNSLVPDDAYARSMAEVLRSRLPYDQDGSIRRGLVELEGDRLASHQKDQLLCEAALMGERHACFWMYEKRRDAGDSDAALVWRDKAADGGHPMACFLRGQSLARQDRFEDARNDLRTAAYAGVAEAADELAHIDRNRPDDEAHWKDIAAGNRRQRRSMTFVF